MFVVTVILVFKEKCCFTDIEQRSQKSERLLRVDGVRAPTGYSIPGTYFLIFNPATYTYARSKVNTNVNFSVPVRA